MSAKIKLLLAITVHYNVPAGMVVALLGLSLGTSDVVDMDLRPTLELSSLLLYVACYQLSFGPMSWLICGEIFPLAVRGPAMALATMTNFSCNFVVSLVLPSLQSELGMTNMYMGFASLSTVALLIFFIVIPETKGKSLEEIEEFFSKDGTPPPDVSMKALPR